MQCKSPIINSSKALKLLRSSVLAVPVKVLEGFFSFQVPPRVTTTLSHEQHVSRKLRGFELKINIFKSCLFQIFSKLNYSGSLYIAESLNVSFIVLNMNHEMTFTFLCDICIPYYTLHLESRHGLNLRKQRTSGSHGDEDIVWNVISSNITDAQTTGNTKFFSEGRESLILKIVQYNYIVKILSFKYNCNITLFSTAFSTTYIKKYNYMFHDSLT